MRTLRESRRDEQHYRALLDADHAATVGLALAASAVYAAAHGQCEAADHATDAWREIARRLRARHGEAMSAAEVLAEMDGAATAAASGGDAA
jgi:hypothetical protein